MNEKGRVRPIGMREKDLGAKGKPDLDSIKGGKSELLPTVMNSPFEHASSVVFLVGLFMATLGPFLIPTLAFLLLALLLFLVAFSRQGLPKFSLMDALLLIFIVTLFMGELVTDLSPDEALEFVRMLSIVAIARHLVPIFGLANALFAFAVHATVVASLASVPALVGSDLSVLEGTKLVTLFMHKNDVAAIVGLGIAALWYLISTEVYQKTRLVLLVGVAILVYLLVHLVALDSLTALGATGICMVLVTGSVLVHRLPRGWRISLLPISLGLVPAALLAGQVLGVFERLGRRSNFHGRMDIWSFTVKDWGQYWLLGAPNGYWNPQRSAEFDASTSLVGPMTVSDNSFLDIFLNQGVIPLLVLATLLGWVTVRAFGKLQSQVPHSYLFEIVLLYLVVISFFSSTLLSPYLLLPFGVAILAVESPLLRTKSRVPGCPDRTLRD